MKLSTQPYKGTRDFYPDDKRVQKWMFDKWRAVCESFGYEEYDGPILEPLDLFTAKTSEEIVNEQTYSFTDRGDRKVVMRPEMTPTVSRMVAARRQELAYPLRLYSIPNCFRYERPQRGRLREFWQLNADIFGVEGIDADVEIIMLADAVMKAFGASEDQYEIRVNSRELMNKRVKAAGLKFGKELVDVTRLIDKMDKMEQSKFAEALTEYIEDVDALLGFFEKDGATEDYEDLEETLKRAGVTNVRFVPSVARGFDYYTDIVFEVFDTNPDNNRSMFGGGRYDGLVSEFGVEPVPTVGFGMGDATLLNFLESNDLLLKQETETDIYIATIGDVAEAAQQVAQKLRAKGKNVAVDLSGRKLDKQIKTAQKKGIAQVLFVGEKELETREFKVKNLETGKEEPYLLDS